MNFLYWNDSTSALSLAQCLQSRNLLAFLGRSIQGTFWFSVLPQTLQTDFFLDRSGFPRSRFPQSGVSFFSFLFLLFFLWFLRVLAQSPLLYFFPFFNKIFSEIDGIGWGFCGVPTQLGCRCFPLMLVQSPGLAKKKTNELIDQ